MFNWNKKEKPFVSYSGMGGGGTGLFSASGPTVTVVTASGGVIHDYTEGGTTYRAHIFTNSGALTVADCPSPVNIDYLVIGGGGGGGGDDHNGGGGGGGGAGGYATNMSGDPYAPHGSTFTISDSTTYPVSIGLGGHGRTGALGKTGRDSTLTHPSASNIVGPGGGGGSYWDPGGSPPGGAGGSGGGSGKPPSAGGTATTNFGNPGGTSGRGGGGGGAGGAAPSDGMNATPGGLGIQNLISGPATNSGITGYNPGNSQYGYFAGGGGGGGDGPEGKPGGIGGGGYGNGGSSGGNPDSVIKNGVDGLGGGGGGDGIDSGDRPGGKGGSGVCIVRYMINSDDSTSGAPRAKATGGSIMWNGTNVVHVFNTPGVFTVTSDIPSANVWVVGGGGSGGSGVPGDGTAGGGGAGGICYHTSKPFTTAASTYPVTIGQGGVGAEPGNTTYSTGGHGGNSVLTDPTAPGTMTGYGGAGGDVQRGSPRSGIPGGCGGGGSGGGSPSASSGGSTTQDNNGGSGHYGERGGDGTGSGNYSGGGGGGCGGAGQNGQNPGNGNGGLGVQIPSAYRHPSDKYVLGAPGPSGTGWFGGGGGAGVGGYDSPVGSGGGPGGPYAGGGNGASHKNSSTYSEMGNHGLANTGGGGGSNTGPTSSNICGGSGGSGVIIIAYPE